MLQPRNVTERLFMRKAAALLPVKDAAIERNSYGVLTYKWEAPCKDVGALWIGISRREIVLSCKISHIHISRSSYSHQVKISNIDLKRRIVRDAIQEASQFLSGHIAASISYLEDGAEQGSGWCKRDSVSEVFAYSKQVFGPGMTGRAWVWSGEVNITNPDMPAWPDATQ